MSDPAKEARARDLSRELRCMVCQNQSIDDSEAPLARDIRLLVRERIAAGDSDAQVIDFLVARYGEFVLLKPRFERQTFVLWLVPPLVLIGGGLALWLQSGGVRRARRKLGPSAADSTEEKRGWRPCCRPSCRRKSHKLIGLVFNRRTDARGPCGAAQEPCTRNGLLLR